MNKNYQTGKNSSNYIYFLTCLITSAFLTSCSAMKPKTSIEMIYPPIIPKEYESSPPEIKKVDNNFTKLKSSKSFSENIEVGRNDPFKPPVFKKEKLVVPDKFKFHGVINASGEVIALVTNDVSYGSLSVGNVGGVDTDLIPDGWIVQKISDDIPRLKLKYLSKSLNIELRD